MLYVGTRNGNSQDIEREDLVYSSIFSAVWPITLFILLPIGYAVTRYEERRSEIAFGVLHELMKMGEPQAFVLNQELMRMLETKNLLVFQHEVKLGKVHVSRCYTDAVEKELTERALLK
jgi:hypothetical protein